MDEQIDNSMGGRGAASEAQEAQHTPGPWSTEDDGDYVRILDSEGARICSVPLSRFIDGWRDPEQEVNVRLIAAAPEMLAALRAWDAALEADYPGGPDGPEGIHASHRDKWRAARAAIARAEGR